MSSNLFGRASFRGMPCESHGIHTAKLHPQWIATMNRIGHPTHLALAQGAEDSLAVAVKSGNSLHTHSCHFLHDQSRRQKGAFCFPLGSTSDLSVRGPLSG